MSNHLAESPSRTDGFATWIRRLCVPIVMFWVAVAALTNVLVPQLEAVGEEHNVALSSPDSPSLQAFQPASARCFTNSTPTVKPWSSSRATNPSA